MARYLRDPAGQPPPPGIEPRRLKIYEELVFNNIKGFIDGAFPVLHSLYEASDWERLAREFVNGHRCHSPYFLEISQEFLRFLLEEYTPRETDPPFMAELAHYEWVELALDVSEDTLPDGEPPDTARLPEAVPRLSPLAWSLAYRFPVHRIGPGFRPAQAEAPTYLVVYRDRADKVRFMEVSAATSRLLELIRDNNNGAPLHHLLLRLADDMGVTVDAIEDYAVEQLEQLVRETVVLVTLPEPVR